MGRYKVHVYLLFLFSTACASPDNHLAQDNDKDGFSEFDGDCDDSNPLAYPGSVQEAVNGECMIDMDGDGFGERDPPENIDPGTDCNDSDFALHSKLEDGDCDGAKAVDDCDDNETSLGPKADDQDCDGVIAIEDCDDNDAGTVQDMDCDGVSSNIDCDDFNASMPNYDQDCDGVLGVEDCDDNDPQNTGQAIPGVDQECPATSCKAIMEQGMFTVSGPYWVKSDDGAVQAFCSMDFEGGGWTRILGVEGAIAPLIAESSAQGLQAALAGQGLISPEILTSYMELTNAQEIRLQCSKEDHGRTFHVIATNPDILNYFADNTATPPIADQSLQVMADDSSFLSSLTTSWGCDEGGTWSHCKYANEGGTPKHKLTDSTVWVHQNFYWNIATENRWECDDHYLDETYSPEGQWYVYIR